MDFSAALGAAYLSIILPSYKDSTWYVYPLHQ